MAGRPAVPTALKIINGNKGKRPLNKHEPQPEPLTNLEPPEWLPSGAKDVWRELAPAMHNVGLLTSADVNAFAMGCCAIAEFRAAAKVTEGNEVIYVGENNRPVMNPAMVVKSMAFKQAMSMLSQFGLTPVSRSKVIAPPKEKDAEKDKGYFS